MNFKIIRKSNSEETEKMRRAQLQELALQWSEALGIENHETSQKFIDKFSLMKNKPEQAEIKTQVAYLKKLIDSNDKESLHSLSKLDTKKILELLR